MQGHPTGKSLEPNPLPPRHADAHVDSCPEPRASGGPRRGQLGVGCPPRVGGGGHRRTTGAYRARGRPHRQALSILGMSCTPITMPQTFIFITIIIQKIKRNKYVSRSNTCIHKYLKIQIYGSQTLSYLLLSTNRRVSWSDTIPSGKDADDLHFYIVLLNH